MEGPGLYPRDIKSSRITGKRIIYQEGAISGRSVWCVQPCLDPARCRDAFIRNVTTAREFLYSRDYVIPWQYHAKILRQRDDLPFFGRSHFSACHDSWLGSHNMVFPHGRN